MLEKFLTYKGLSYFFDKCKELFSLKGHTHTKSEITDLQETLDSLASSGGITYERVTVLPNIADADENKVYVLNTRELDTGIQGLAFKAIKIGSDGGQGLDKVWSTFGFFTLSALFTTISCLGVECLNGINPIAAALLSGNAIYKNGTATASNGSYLIRGGLNPSFKIETTFSSNGKYYYDIYFMDTDTEGNIVTAIISVNEDGTQKI